jgi:hypothetical protein
LVIGVNEMIKKSLALGSAVLWAAAAMGYAATADAYLYTYQSGYFAACSANYYAQANSFCWSDLTQSYAVNMSYVQGIKLVSTYCYSGSCVPDSSTVYTDQIYSTVIYIVNNLGAFYIHCL